MPNPGVISAAASLSSNMFSSGGSLLDGTMIDESAIQRDARGLPRYVRATGASLLTPSSTPPGREPKTENSNSQPGDNIVPWYQWDDAYYNWQIATERYGLPRDYVPPSIPKLSLEQPVIVNTEAAVKAGAVADRLAAGIDDGDYTSTGTPLADVGKQISLVAPAPGAALVNRIPAPGVVPSEGAFVPLGAPGSALEQEAAAGDGNDALWLKLGLFFLAVMVGLFVFRSAKVRS